MSVSHLWVITEMDSVARCDQCELAVTNALKVLTGFQPSPTIEEAVQFVNETFEDQGMTDRMVSTYEGECVDCGAKVEAQVAS